MANIYSLPVEIQEKILSFLNMSELVTAIRSCHLWQLVAEERLLKNWCLNNISADFLAEITNGKLIKYGHNTQALHDLDWKYVLEKWSKTIYEDTNSAVIQSTTECGDNNLDGSRERPAVSSTRPVIVSSACHCFAASGDFVIVGDTYNNLIWYNGNNGKKIFVKPNYGEPVTSISLLNVIHEEPFRTNDEDDSMLEHDVVIVTSREFVSIFSMPIWNCQELFYSNEKHGMKTVSVQGNQFVLYNSNEKTLSVFRVVPSELMIEKMKRQTREIMMKWDVSVVRVNRFVTPCHARDVKLWKKKLIVLLQDGSVVTYDNVFDSLGVSSSFIRSKIINDFLYPFDSFMFRGLILVNVSTARALLNYWHVNTGPPHWLVSSDGLVFKQMRSVLGMKDEITTVCIKRTLIVVGTNEGRIYFYRHTADDANILTAITERPIVIVKVTNAPIYRCDFGIGFDSCLVFARTINHTILAVKLAVTEDFSL